MFLVKTPYSILLINLAPLILAIHVNIMTFHYYIHHLEYAQLTSFIAYNNPREYRFLKSLLPFPISVTSNILHFSYTKCTVAPPLTLFRFLFLHTPICSKHTPSPSLFHSSFSSPSKHYTHPLSLFSSHRSRQTRDLKVTQSSSSSFHPPSPPDIALQGPLGNIACSLTGHVFRERDSIYLS